MTSTDQFLKNKKVALVYDWFDSWGGAERVLLELHKHIPHADWFTSYVNRDVATWAADISPIHTSFIQNVPFIRRSRRLSTALYPFAFEEFDFTDYDVVISVTSSFAKSIVTKPGTTHINYMLTPSRFLWIKDTDYIGKTKQQLLKSYMSYIKKWDLVAAQRPDHIICISQTVADRIKDIYNRDAHVIYPPFDTDYWENTLRHSKMPAGGLPESYYLVVSRIRPYKKVDLVVKAFSKMKDKNLVVVGSGRKKDIAYLKKLSKKNVHFLSDLTDNELAYVYGHAKGLIMPQEEDFGYVSLEAQTCSCPVIAYNKGGVRETVKQGKTGYLFDHQSVKGISEAIEKFEPMAYTVQRYLQTSSSSEMKQFETESFITKFTQQVNSLI